MVIQTKNFDANKQIVHHSNNDDVIMVNATLDPYLDVRAQVTRYRILNGSSQRVFNLGLTGGHTTYQIASDGGCLVKPVSITRLWLAPGERAGIPINFSEDQGKTISLMSYASGLQNGIYGATNPGMGPGMTMTNYNPNALNGADFKIMNFKIGSPNSSAITSIPSSLITNNSIPVGSANITRNLTLNPEFIGMNQLNGNFQINNTSFDMGVINYRIPLNNIEIWSIRNLTGIAHPFHIHDMQFQIIDRNGTAVSTQESGRKDVVLIKPQETVRFITQFLDFADTTTPYMFHCHMLKHEDEGMMGQFVVYDTSGHNTVDNKTQTSSIRVYPNPAKGSINIRTAENQELQSYAMYSSSGAIVKQGTFNANTRLYNVDVANLNAGIYVIHVVTPKGSITRKIFLQ
ncbi:MAG: blue copper oxidase [Bacteroidia bacterium]